MKRTVFAAIVSVFLAGISLADNPISKPLFYIQRSKNANVVHYDAQLNGDGTFFRNKPVIAYWVMLAEDGRREGLNLIERTKAYGFDIELDGSGKFYRMTLAAYSKRDIKVYAQSDNVKAEMVISGKPAYLEKVFIDSKEGWAFPTVLSIELFGTDVSTGEKRSEKVVP